MEINKQNIIGDLVAKEYRTAVIFKKHGIDFCCNGNRSIEEACDKKNIDTDKIVKELQDTVAQTTQNGVDYNTWALDKLADYIIEKHHKYVENKILEIQPFLNKIVKVHGDRHPELAEVEYLFNASAGELTMHMKKEELILFPFIRKMVKVQLNNEAYQAPPFGSVENPIAMMHHEHDTEGERFRKIEELTNNYTPPLDACNTYKVTFAMLQEFENDLHLHIHLENNILFPKAIKLEQQLNS